MTNGIAVIGAGMIGAAHASGYRSHLPRFSKSLPNLELRTVCDGNETVAENLAQTYGFQKVSPDWRETLQDPNVTIVSVCLPNFLHAEVAGAAFAAGKHVICEKPLALNSDDGKRVIETALKSGRVGAAVSNYRRFPAVAEVKRRIGEGDIGKPIHLQIQYQAEYAADPLLPHTWRYEHKRAGAGALLDVGTHAIDAARFLCGDIIEVMGAASLISIRERRLPGQATMGHNRIELSDEVREVDNDDVTSAVLLFANGCQGTFVASRVAVGMGNTLSFIVSGTKGTMRFTSERPGELQLAKFDGSGFSPFLTIANRPASPYAAALLPVPHDGVAVGYAEAFGFMMHEFLSAIAEGRGMDNGSLSDGLRAVEVLEAIERSALVRAPVTVGSAQ